MTTYAKSLSPEEAARRKREYMAAYNLRPECQLRRRLQQQSAEHRATKKAYRQTPKARAAESARSRSAATHDRRVQQLYGMAPGQYAEMLEAQGGVCMICGNNPRTLRLAVDHDHVTGRVRGLLCRRCNRGLGHWEADVTKMKFLVLYLEEIIQMRNKCNPEFGYHADPHVGCVLR